jgi:DNA-directed RNA polymerase specialized sigma24 family protein
MDGRSFQELAEEWDEPLGTLLSRKSRAKARLREMLSEYKK